MLTSKIILFSSILFAAANIPGPNLIFLVAHIFSKGIKGITYYIFALLLGEIFWLSTAYLGLSFLLEHTDYAITIIKWLGVVYLTYIAFNLWRANTHGEVSRQQMTSKSMFTTGLFLSVGNPKIMIFYASVLPFVIQSAERGLTLLFILIAIMVVVVSFVYMVWSAVAVKLRKFLEGPDIIKSLNKGCALLMIMCAIFIALSQ